MRRTAVIERDLPISLYHEWLMKIAERECAMHIWGKVPRWQILGGLMIAGALLVWVPDYFGLTWDHGILHGLGEACLIGAIFGFTIERWFREDFAHDVFYAALGALLRPEFRDELRWLASFDWLAVKSICKVNLEDMGDGLCRFTLRMERELENISSYSQKMQNYIGTDDWGVDGHPSEIKICGIQRHGDQRKDANDFKEKAEHISATTEEVSIDPGERVILFAELTEYKRKNDIYVLTLTSPTKDPEVEIEASPTLTYTVGFTHRGKLDESVVIGKKTLKGTFLPSQVMIVRWWPKDKNRLTRNSESSRILNGSC